MFLQSCHTFDAKLILQNRPYFMLTSQIRLTESGQQIERVREMSSVTAAPSETHPANTQYKIRQFQGDKVQLLERHSDGTVDSQGGQTGQNVDWFESSKSKLAGYLLPDNLTESVSKDYLPTRKWQLAHDFLGSMAGTASLGAVMTAVGPANLALAGLGVAAATVSNVTWMKDRMGQLSSFASTKLAKVAEKNPRPWLMGTELINSTATILDASTAVISPGAFYPLMIGLSIARSVNGAASGAAGAGITPRQAKKDNIGEVTVKNSNQSTIATFAGATVGIGALAALGGMIGFGPAAVVVASIGSLGTLGATYKKLQALDYNPINENAMRRVVDQLDSTGEVVGPDKKLLNQVASMFRSDRLVAGRSIEPLLADPRFPQWREQYQSRPYIMTIQDGAPYIVMKDDLSYQDTLPSASGPLPERSDYTAAMAQVQAVYQAIEAEKLLSGPQYAELAKTDVKEAENWVLKESLKKTPDDVRPLLTKMQQAGWSVDTVRFFGEQRPATIEAQNCEATSLQSGRNPALA